jgi:hypothetical protein
MDMLQFDNDCLERIIECGEEEEEEKEEKESEEISIISISLASSNKEKKKKSKKKEEKAPLKRMSLSNLGKEKEKEMPEKEEKMREEAPKARFMDTRGDTRASSPRSSAFPEEKKIQSLKSSWKDEKESEKLVDSFSLLRKASLSSRDKGKGKIDRPNDKLAQIQCDLEDVKSIMNQNIDRVLERGESIDSLLEKSDLLQACMNSKY